MRIGEIIRHRRKSLGISADELGQRIGKNRATIYRYENGDIENLPYPILEPLASALETSVNYLMGQADDPASSAAGNSLSPVSNAFPVPDIFSVPVQGSISCDKPEFADGNQEIISPAFKADFCLKVEDDSMKNAGIHHGDLVFIREQSEVESGEIAAVTVDNGSPTLKRFYDYGNTVVLHPDNPDCKEQVFTSNQLARIRVLGKAIAKLSPIR